MMYHFKPPITWNPVRIAFLFGLFFIFTESIVSAINSDEILIKGFINRYGKYPIIQVILAYNDNDITLDVRGKRIIYSGNPDESYVNVHTILCDLKTIHLTPKKLEKLINDRIKPNTLVLFKQMSRNLKSEALESRKDREKGLIDSFKREDNISMMIEEEKKRLLNKKEKLEEEIKKEALLIKQEDQLRKEKIRLIERKQVIEEEIKTEAARIRRENSFN